MTTEQLRDRVRASRVWLHSSRDCQSTESSCVNTPTGRRACLIGVRRLLADHPRRSEELEVLAVELDEVGIDVVVLGGSR
jgi:hypothetical protein